MTREEVKAWLKHLKDDAHEKADSIVPCDIEIALGIAIEALEQPKKGHWKKPDFADDKKWHQCSECGVTTEKLDKNGFKLICNYCPVCGADMRKDGDTK